MKRSRSSMHPPGAPANNVTAQSPIVLTAETYQCIASGKPLEHGELVAADGIAEVRPGEQTTWYFCGPPNDTVTVSLRRIANTGGHNHAGGPTGAAEPVSFTLGSNYPQNHPVIFTAPVAAGSIEMLGSFSSGGSGTTGMNRVRIPGLVALAASVGLTLTGASPTHPQNHYGVPALITRIQQLSYQFYTKFGKNLIVNDMSLPDGGLYDFQNTWSPPHATHREGRTVDINSTTQSAEGKAFFRTTATGLGFAVTLETNPEHWHLSI